MRFGGRFHVPTHGCVNTVVEILSPYAFRRAEPLAAVTRSIKAVARGFLTFIPQEEVAHECNR